MQTPTSSSTRIRLCGAFTFELGGRDVEAARADLQRTELADAPRGLVEDVYRLHATLQLAVRADEDSIGPLASAGFVSQPRPGVESMNSI